MNLQTQPIMSNFGVEVVNIDLSQPIPPELFSELRDQYFEHSLLLFRNQNLQPSDQARLAHQFGKPKIETRKQFNLIDHPEV